MGYDWYFSEELCPSKVGVDNYADSKFSTDKWCSFAREIVQNSLDAQADPSKPVDVIFDLNKSLTLNDIPGASHTLKVLRKCEELASNKQTKSAYKKGIEILNKKNIYCLKISDYNTKGVETGRDKAWGAFLYDEGVSFKHRPGSAGSHGVGKKVPFIISSCNTVYYSTKNRYMDENKVEHSDILFEGKTSLINWIDEENIRRSPKGWLGVINHSTNDPSNKIDPLINEQVECIPDYFKRTNDYGTDVIIIGVNAYECEDDIKKSIIKAILENFYVAIDRNILNVIVFGEKISRETFKSVYNKWYDKPTDRYYNSLDENLSTLSNEPVKYTIQSKSGEEIGNIKIYFKLGNKNNKKYYSIIRSQGMTIREYCIRSAEQPFSSVVIVEGEVLNELLSILENAAHDDFITKDENMEIPKDSIYAFEQVNKAIKDFIISSTKLGDGEFQNVESLSSIISMPGTYASINRKDIKPQIRKNPIKRKSKNGSKSSNYGEGTGSAGGKEKKEHKKKLGNKPMKKGGKFKSVLYEKFIIPPVFIRNGKYIMLRFQPSDTIINASIKISSINSEEKADNSVNDVLSYVMFKGQKLKIENGIIRGVDLSNEQPMDFYISFKRSVVYQLKAEISYTEEDKQ